MAIDYDKGMRPNLYELMQGGGGGGYVLPPATTSSLGGVIVGEGLEVSGDGTLSASGSAPTDVYTKAETDALIAEEEIARINADDSISDDMDALASELRDDIDTLTDALTDVYTKAETDALIAEEETARINADNTKQDTLVSGTNIKTVDSQSLLGAGNIEVIKPGINEVDSLIVRSDGLIFLDGQVVIQGDVKIQDLAAPEYGTDAVNLDTVYELMGKYDVIVGEERLLGSWVEPGVPTIQTEHYQKVINCGTLPNQAGSLIVPHGIANMGMVTALRGIAIPISGSGSMFPLPFVAAATQNIMTLACGWTNITIEVGKDRSGFKAYVAIDYIKAIS